jgi:hypothetical protein
VSCPHVWRAGQPRKVLMQGRFSTSASSLSPPSASVRRPVRGSGPELQCTSFVLALWHSSHGYGYGYGTGGRESKMKTSIPRQICSGSG